ncbi:MAG TPA: hypothetical protein VFT81_02890, partial [Dermatophilaceae bacterium]|nr:hypothetical protein [Dermatophilaceae bacterium]
MTLSRLKTMPYAVGLAALMALGGCGTAEERPSAQPSAGSSPASTSATTATAKATASVDPVLARIP